MTSRLVRSMQPNGDIPAGQHAATLVLGQRINAGTNGEYHSTMDATLRSITTRES